MSRQSITKDERFLLELYKLQEEKGEGATLFLDEMQARMELSYSAAKNIARLLAQTGFIRHSHRDKELQFLPKGILLAQNLREQEENS